VPNSLARNMMALLLTLWLGACAKPPLVELETARNQLDIAAAAGAAELAPEAFLQARSVLLHGESLIAEEEYDHARQILPFAAEKAKLATRQARSRKDALEQEKRRQQKILEELQRQQQQAEQNKSVPRASIDESTEEQSESVTMVTPAPPPSPPPPQPVFSYQVTPGETLWTISAQAEVYADPLLWPLLYKANRDQIKDPRQIYQGQVLTVPRKHSQADLDEARATARSSEIFPVPKGIRNSER